MQLPKAIITDIDGVWTDGGYYYDGVETQLRKFNTIDSSGVSFCQVCDIALAIITTSRSEAVKHRARKLHIADLFLGADNKLTVANAYVEQRGWRLNQIAYIGDAVNDIPLLRVAGYAGTVPHAPAYVKRHVDMVTRRPAGHGAFAEFVETILDKCGMLDTAVERYIASLENSDD